MIKLTPVWIAAGYVILIASCFGLGFVIISVAFPNLTQSLALNSTYACCCDGQVCTDTYYSLDDNRCHYTQCLPFAKYCSYESSCHVMLVQDREYWYNNGTGRNISGFNLTKGLILYESFDHCIKEVKND